MTYDCFDVVVVPFPFTDRTASKRRPALVISSADTFNGSAGHSVLAMITSSVNEGWPLDVRITDLPSAGLSSPSVVRMKLFTLDHQLIERKAGALSEADRKSVRAAIRRLLKTAGDEAT